jgi:hypothetical protein
MTEQQIVQRWLKQDKTIFHQDIDNVKPDGFVEGTISLNTWKQRIENHYHCHTNGCSSSPKHRHLI